VAIAMVMERWMWGNLSLATRGVPYVRGLAKLEYQVTMGVVESVGEVEGKM